MDTAECVTADDFESVYSRYWRPVSSYIYRLVRDSQLADDLAQDTLLRAWRALSGGATVRPAVFSHWLYTIARNLALDALRRRHFVWLSLERITAVEKHVPGDTAKPTVNVLDMVSAFGVQPEGARFEQRIADQEIARFILRRLGSADVALLLRVYDGLSYAQIERASGLGHGMLRMRLMRARQRARALYRQVAQ